VLESLRPGAAGRRTGVVAALVALLAVGALALAAPPAGIHDEAAPTAGGERTAGDPTSATVDPRTEYDAPTRRPAALLASLAEARAAAWRAADPSLLATAEAAGSPVRAHDHAAVTELARTGLRYEGLRYDVELLATVSASGSGAVLRARLATRGYDVVGPGQRTPRPAQRGEVVLVDLTWSAHGWRVAGIRPDA
jgi:hypothetical protein